MPYVEKIVRPVILKDPSRVRNVGDLNFCYSSVYKALWIKTQSYATIELITAIGLSHETPQFIKELDLVFKKRSFTETQLVRAKFLALGEFMRRVGDSYEDAKIVENGDMYTHVPYADVKEPQALNPGAKKRGRKPKHG